MGAILRPFCTVCGACKPKTTVVKSSLADILFTSCLFIGPSKPFNIQNWVLCYGHFELFWVFENAQTRIHLVFGASGSILTNGVYPIRTASNTCGGGPACQSPIEEVYGGTLPVWTQ
jgi:hypothetical protein